MLNSCVTMLCTENIYAKSSESKVNCTCKSSWLSGQWLCATRLMHPKLMIWTMRPSAQWASVAIIRVAWTPLRNVDQQERDDHDHFTRQTPFVRVCKRSAPLRRASCIQSNCAGLDTLLRLSTGGVLQWAYHSSFRVDFRWRCETRSRPVEQQQLNDAPLSLRWLTHRRIIHAPLLFRQSSRESFGVAAIHTIPTAANKQSPVKCLSVNALTNTRHLARPSLRIITASLCFFFRCYSFVSKRFPYFALDIRDPCSSIDAFRATRNPAWNCFFKLKNVTKKWTVVKVELIRYINLKQISMLRKARTVRTAE